MAVTEKKVYQTRDNEVHDTELQANVHEAKLDVLQIIKGIDNRKVQLTEINDLNNAKVLNLLVKMGEQAKFILENDKSIELILSKM